MKNFYLLFFSLIIGYSSYGQIYAPTSYLTDSNGAILKQSKVNDDVQGSQYLNDVWATGQVITPQGKVLDVEKMKFNLIMNRIEFETGGRVFELTIPCQTFKINLPSDNGSIVSHTFKSNFPKIDLQNERSFYEVLYDGESKLLKLHKIRVSDYAEPGSMTRTKHFTKVSILYIYHPQKKILTPVSNKRAELLSIFSDQKESIEKFLIDNKIKKKPSDGALMLVCQFYDGQISQ